MVGVRGTCGAYTKKSPALHRRASKLGYFEKLEKKFWNPQIAKGSSYIASDKSLRAIVGITIGK